MSDIDTLIIPAPPEPATGGRHRLETLDPTPGGWYATCSCSNPDGNGDGLAEFPGFTPGEAVTAWMEHEEESRADRQRNAQASVLGELDVAATIIRRADGHFMLIVADSAVVLTAEQWTTLRGVR
jgi:hypothetical protein